LSLPSTITVTYFGIAQTTRFRSFADEKAAKLKLVSESRNLSICQQRFELLAG